MFARFLTIIVIASGFVISTKGQEVIIKGQKTVVVRGSNKVNRIYVPPLVKLDPAKGNLGANITVNYSGFTTEPPKNAIAYAVSILASIIPSNVKITIDVRWGTMTDQSILGSSSPGAFVLGSAFNAPYPDSYYPVTLAEKMAGRSFNSDLTADIGLTINKKATWYTGTDGNTPTDMYDLVTVALHEFLHGLGFYDSFSVSNGAGYYNSTGVYDQFIENQSGRRLIDKQYFQSGTTELYNELTSGKLYFNGPVLRNLLSGGKAQLYAPSTYEEGSSISHLDESKTLRINQLMTPVVGLAEAIHSPGPVTMAILADLGWIHTRMGHAKKTDTEAHLATVPFSLSIVSDSIFAKDNVGLVWSFDNFTTSDTLYLVPPTEGDTFRVSLDVPSYNTKVSYYFYSTDLYGRIFRLPVAGKTTPYSFFIGADTVKPVIIHSRYNWVFDKINLTKFNCKATDNIGIDTVYLEYRKNSGTSFFSGLGKDSTDYFSTTVNLKTLKLSAGDILQYRIVAVDNTSGHNTRYYPSTGFFQVAVQATMPVVEGYATDFTSSVSDFILDGFSILKPSGFTSPSLHTKHPYESPEKDNAEINYTAVLKYPVKADQTGMVISFKEIVLVEPGETGSVYGDPDFYDYVIVEGSKDFGSTWFPFADGYDSRISSIFESDYLGAVSGQNSTFTGSQDMFINHTIDNRSFTSFSKTDTLMIRFRLFSDPFAHGWGWAIDDLSIKSVAAGVEIVPESSIRLYPNPGEGIISVVPGSGFNGGSAKLTVYNLSGRIIRNYTIDLTSILSIDISDQPPGMYLISFRQGRYHTIFKYSKVR